MMREMLKHCTVLATLVLALRTLVAGAMKKMKQFAIEQLYQKNSRMMTTFLLKFLVSIAEISF